MSAFEWLFPGWSSPTGVAALVAARLLCNCALTALVARSAGRGSPLAGVAAGLTLFSTAATVLLLRPGWLGYHASFLELGAQVALLTVGAFAVYAAPTRRRVATAVGVGAVAVGLGLLTLVLYGETFVAP